MAPPSSSVILAVYFPSGDDIGANLYKRRTAQPSITSNGIVTTRIETPPNCPSVENEDQCSAERNSFQPQNAIPSSTGIAMIALAAMEIARELYDDGR